MAVSPLAGKPPQPSDLVDVAKLVTAYFTETPDPLLPSQRVAFGTSGHRGSSFDASFNEAHILAITQAICLYRKQKGYGGPVYLGIDTHALSEPALASALEVLAANAVDVCVDAAGGYTPTPVVSHAILTHNRGKTGEGDLADGIVITPSHNPPKYGGFKYNPPSGGPADTDATKWIEERANGFLADGLRGVSRMPYVKARHAPTVHPHPYLDRYVGDLPSVVDLEAIRASGLKLGVDPLGGASVAYWAAIGERYKLNLEVVNAAVDPTFRFMTLDWDGQIRMDPSSVHAMARMVSLRDRFDVAFANDADADRHGIVTRGRGLLEPNHYLSAAIAYLFEHKNRPELAGVRRHRQDAGVERDDRPRRGPPEASARRGAGGLQVVRGGPPFGDARVRRRGERRRLLSAPRRRRLDDRQGRHRPGPARRGDHGAHGPGSRRALPRARRGVRLARLCPGRRPGDARREGAAPEALPRVRLGHDARRRTRDSRSSPARPGTARRSEG